MMMELRQLIIRWRYFFINSYHKLINTSTIGSYSVTYNVSDSSGNAAAEVSRTVNVGPDVNAGSDITVCEEATINIGSNSNNLSYDYQWTASQGATANGPTLNSRQHQFLK